MRVVIFIACATLLWGTTLLWGMDALAAAQGDASAPPIAWPTYHGDFSLDGRATSGVPDRPVKLWRFSAPEGIEHTPVIGGGAVYFTDASGLLYAIDLAGKLRWKRKVSEDGFASPPVYLDGAILVGGGDGILRAFEAKTGAPRWTYDVEGAIIGSANRVVLPAPSGQSNAAPAIGVIVVSQADGALHCVHFATGKRLWKTESLERCDGSVSVAKDTIIMGSCAAAMHLFSVKQAGKVADVTLGDECQVAGGVSVSKGIAFAGTRSGRVFAVDVAKKKVLWQNRETKREAFTTPAVDDDYVFFGADDRQLYCVDRNTGTRVWKFDAEDVPLSPVIARNRVVIAAGGTLIIVDRKTGKKVWSTEISDQLTSPAVAGGMIIVGADDGTVTAFGTKS